MPLSHQNHLARIDELIRSGMMSEAKALCQDVLQHDARQARAWIGLGIVALHSQQYPPAEEAFRRAIELNPHDANSWHHLSIALHEQRQFDEAESCSQQALAINSQPAPFWLHLGNVHFSQERFGDAAHAFRQSLARDPFNPTTWINLAGAQHVQGNLDEAQQAYESSLALSAAQTETRLKLALLLKQRWSLVEAEALLKQVIADDPRHLDAWAMLGQIALSLGKQTEALAALERAHALSPTPGSQSRILQCLQYDDSITSPRLLAAHREWNAYTSESLHVGPAIRPRLRTHEERKLRLGFVSRDLGVSPVGFLVLPLLEHLNKARCSITCYFDARTEDHLTPRFRAAADRWRVIDGWRTEAVVEQIRQDEIDVLVDLMGHSGVRLPVFAMKPAPWQATWFGYVGTTGLSAMDFLVADRFHVRPGEEANYLESILRMPNDYACYGPPDDAPEVSPLPARHTGSVTFGCFNNPAKYSPQIFDAFANVLRRVPASRMLLKYGGLHQAVTQQRLYTEIAKRDVDPSRILFEGWSPHRELLARYSQVDIALDTQPYSGGLTTCEALWMGVPVITYPGQTFASRHSVSHLTNAGFPQFIATDQSGYVELAVQWANRLDELSSIRTHMRDQVRRSPLCDASAFAADFLSLMTDVWNQKSPAKK